MDELEVGGGGGGGAAAAAASGGGEGGREEDGWGGRGAVEALNEKFLHADHSADSV